MISTKTASLCNTVTTDSLSHQSDQSSLAKVSHVTVASEPERIGVFLTRSCVHVTDISCGVVYKATLASLVLFRSYRYVPHRREKKIKLAGEMALFWFKDSRKKDVRNFCKNSHNSSFGTEQGLLRLLCTQPHRKYQPLVHNPLLRTHQFILVLKLPLLAKVESKIHSFLLAQIIVRPKE